MFSIKQKPLVFSDLILSNQLVLGLEKKFSNRLVLEVQSFDRDDFTTDLFNLVRESVSDSELSDRLDFISGSDEIPSGIVYHLKPLYRAFKQKCKSLDQKYLVKLLEDIALFIYHFVNSKSKIDYTLAIVNFVKLRVNGPLLDSKMIFFLIEYANELFIGTVTSGLNLQSVDEMFSEVRGYLDNYEEVKNAAIFKKIYKFAMYAMSLSLFDKIGITFSNLNFSKLEAEAIKAKHHLGVDFIYTLIDTLVFLCERGYQCMKTGSMDPLYHSGKSYEKFFVDANKLKRQFLLLKDPELHGFTEFEFLSNLDAAIEKGEAIYKHTVRLGDYEKKTVRAFVNDLHMIKCECLTLRNARESRKPPFAVLIAGGSSIGKSTITSMLFAHYAKLRNLPRGDHYIYTKNPVSKFWDGFNSSMWGLLLDDISFMHPNKAPQGDPSIMEMIQVINGVPFCPDQAALQDKGRTPLKCDMVIATTNTEHLNSYYYFTCPLAVNRRLPYVIAIKPKKEYSKNDGSMLDSTKCIDEDGLYPDFWQWTVKKVMPCGNQSELSIIHVFEHTNDFLAWFNVVAMEHEFDQKQVKACDSKMKDIQLCPGCKLPIEDCRCTDHRIQTMYETSRGMRLFDTDSESDNDSIVNLKLESRSYIDSQVDDTLDSFINEIEINDKWYNRIWNDISNYMFILCMKLYIEFRIVRTFVGWLYSFPFVYFCVKALTFTKLPKCISDTKKFWSNIGSRVERNIGYVPLLVTIVTILSTSTAVYFTCLYIKRLFSPTRNMKSEGAVNSKEYKSSFIGKAPENTKPERENVWYKDDYQTTTFDVNPMNTSYKAFNFDETKQVLIKNCFHFQTELRDCIDGRMATVYRRNKAIAIGGHIYMCNDHFLPKEGEFTL